MLLLPPPNSNLLFLPYEQSSEVVLDPSDREELVATGTLTFGMNAHNEVCCVHKLGGTAIKPATLIRCARIAAKKVLLIPCNRKKLPH